MDFGHIPITLRSRESNRKVIHTTNDSHTRVPRGFVPTTLSEPSDSILSSPEHLSEDLATDCFSSELVFGDIEDEFINEPPENSEVLNNVDKLCNLVSIDKMSKRSSRSRTSSKSSNVDTTEIPSNPRKRPNSGNSKSRDGSKEGVVAVSKKARNKGSGDSVVVQKTQCSRCKEYFDPSEFRRHNRNAHEFPCDQENCDYFLETALSLINHKKKVHMIEPNNSYSSNWQVECEACGKSISNKKKEAHLKTFHPFPCKDCPMRFLTQGDLDKHSKKDHKGVSANKIIEDPVEVIAIVPKIMKDANSLVPLTNKASRVSKTCSPPPVPRNKSPPVPRNKSPPVPKINSPLSVPKCEQLQVLQNESPPLSTKKVLKSSETSFGEPLALRPNSPMDDEPYWVCTLCDDLFPTLEKFTEHINSEKAHRVPCKHEGCTSKQSSQADLFKHMHWRHGSMKQVKFCPRCNDFLDSKSYAGHKKRAHGSKCGYPGCDATFLQNRILWQHMIKKHNWGRRMNPEEATIQGETEEVLFDSEVEESEIVHDSKDFDVDVVIDQIENGLLRDEGAKSRNSVSSHEIIEQVVEAYEGKLIRCQACRLLYRRDKIAAHGKKLHKFNCPQIGCNLAFTQEHLLDKHCYIDHDIAGAEQKYLVCPECLEFFGKELEKTYENHVKKGIHLTCDKCGKKFANFNEHLYRYHCDFDHSCDQDERCGICDIQFTCVDIKLAQRHRQELHIYGPCLHCKELHGKDMMFVTKERFIKHHEAAHSSMVHAGCDCKNNINSIEALNTAPFNAKVDDEDAYDLTEQITDESSDEDMQCNFTSDIIGVTRMENGVNLESLKHEFDEDLSRKEPKVSQEVEVVTVAALIEAEKVKFSNDLVNVDVKNGKAEEEDDDTKNGAKVLEVTCGEVSVTTSSNSVDENENLEASQAHEILPNENVADDDVIIEEMCFDDSCNKEKSQNVSTAFGDASFDMDVEVIPLKDFDSAGADLDNGRFESRSEIISNGDTENIAEETPPIIAEELLQIQDNAVEIKDEKPPEVAEEMFELQDDVVEVKDEQPLEIPEIDVETRVEKPPDIAEEVLEIQDNVVEVKDEKPPEVAEELLQIKDNVVEVKDEQPLEIPVVAVEMRVEKPPDIAEELLEIQDNAVEVKDEKPLQIAVDVSEIQDDIVEASDGNDDAFNIVEEISNTKKNIYLMDIQDNSISTTENIETLGDPDVSVEELIDSDPEVSSSVRQDLNFEEDDTNDSDMDGDENLIGISQQGIIEKEENVNITGVEEDVALEVDSHRSGREDLIGISQQGITDNKDNATISGVEISGVPQIKEELNVTPVNLVPYIDTDSDCDSMEDLEKKNAAAGKLTIKPEISAIVSAVDKDLVIKDMMDDKGISLESGAIAEVPCKGPVLIQRKGGHLTISSTEYPKVKSESQNKELLHSNNVVSAKVEEVQKLNKRSLSCDAQIVFLDQSTDSGQLDELEVDDYINKVRGKSIKMEVDQAGGEKIPVGKVNEYSSDIVTEAIKYREHLSISSNFLDTEISPSSEEVQRAMKRIRRKSGEKNDSSLSACQVKKIGGLGLKFSLQRKTGKSPPKVPKQSYHEELVNFSTHIKEEEYSFHGEHQEVGSYQSLIRPGKPGRKKPCKSAFSHETEETQMQADIARQQQEKRNHRAKQNNTGKLIVGGVGSTLPRIVPATSATRPVPRPILATQPTNLLRASAPPPVSVLLASLVPLAPPPFVVPQPLQPQIQPQQLCNPLSATITPPTSDPEQRMMPLVPQQFVSGMQLPQPPLQLAAQPSKRPPTMQHMTAESVKAGCSNQTTLAETDVMLVRRSKEEHLKYGSVRRSTETIDHCYVMDIDSDDFDLSEKLDEMEEEFERSEASDNTATEESLENIKSLLDSQVTAKTSLSTPSKFRGTLPISSSDSDDLGLYSPGDQEPVASSSVILLDNDVHLKSEISNHSDIPAMKVIQEKDEKEIPVRKTQEDAYDDDIDDLLGDSDDEEPEPEVKKVVIAPPPKVSVPSEPSRKKPPNFVCPECGQKYGKNEAQYNNHIRQQHNFPCKYCPLKFTYVNGLEEHLNSVHIYETEEANSAGFMCSICKRKFKRRGPYVKHTKRDHNIPCIECDMSFTNDAFLEEHMASVHGINSPPSNKALEIKKPSSPVEVKFQLANGLINDSPPKKSRHREHFYHNGDKKDHVKKALKMSTPKDASKKAKNSKSILKKMVDFSFLSEDDTICEKCGQKFEELEAFEHHIELPHEHQCGMKNCELSFVFQYYLDLHIYDEHKTGIKPDERDKPIEEQVPVASTSRNDSYSSMEDQISLADLAVSEDYLPGIGPQSIMGGVDTSKMKSLKNYRIPKKGPSPVKDESGLSFNSSWSSSDSPTKNNEHNKDSDSLHVNRNTLGAGSSPYKCYECNISFKDKHGLDNHVLSHYSPSPSTSKQVDKGQSRLKKIKCPLCTRYFEDIAIMMDHLKAKHKNGKRETNHDFWCGRCRKGFESEKKFEDHEKIEHKYECRYCYKAYILEVDLNHHVEKHHREKSHKVQIKHREGFTCQLCGVNISQMEMFKIHQSKGHNFSCYHDGCSRRFQHKRELESHLKCVHNIVQIKIGDDAEDEHRGYLTTERSQANIDIAEWAESWIDSPLAIEHMKKVMKGVVKSRRHDLFLDKREREQCSGSETSRLYQLSNPGFLGGGGEKDTAVITHLRDRVFMEYFQKADPKLRELGIESAFLYANCVLFPETFIHQHQAQGKSREEAEQAFMEVAVDVEERKALNQEIREAAVLNRRDTEEDSGDEWVDHSDMEDEIDD